MSKRLHWQLNGILIFALSGFTLLYGSTTPVKDETLFAFMKQAITSSNAIYYNLPADFTFDSIKLEAPIPLYQFSPKDTMWDITEMAKNTQFSIIPITYNKGIRCLALVDAKTGEPLALGYGDAAKGLTKVKKSYNLSDLTLYRIHEGGIFYISLTIDSIPTLTPITPGWYAAPLLLFCERNAMIESLQKNIQIELEKSDDSLPRVTQEKVVRDSSGITLFVTPQYQRKSNWCWATCSEMISRYYGKPIHQDQFAKRAFDDTLNLINFFYTSSRYPNEYKLFWESDSIVPMGVNRLLGDISIGTTHYYRKLTYSELKQEISKEKPFLIFWTIGGGGHAVTAVGFRADSLVEIIDPIYGNGFIAMNYRFLSIDRQYIAQRWTGTLLTSHTISDTIRKYPQADSQIIWMMDPEYRIETTKKSRWYSKILDWFRSRFNQRAVAPST